MTGRETSCDAIIRVEIAITIFGYALPISKTALGRKP
jgi:hypothetical protein